ncbi:hypothetical protein F511_29046 [Dorcoceras hygrometricum]|uniref:Uncharacterized protein n=1 Tax=Dorcoceras hygrometricum TaxID=472368 RepID=A0A2Z7C4M2_9LAMI|nr:hypothetical protein F511_29046 [Dorcoceras hygrometricum]
MFLFVRSWFATAGTYTRSAENRLAYSATRISPCFRFLLAQNHAAGHFLKAEICYNTANILAQFLIIITLNLLPEANPDSTLLRRLRLLKTEIKPQELLTQKLTLAEERTHRLFSKASKSSSFAFPLPAKFDRLERQKSISSNLPFSFRKIQQQRLNNNRTKTLQNDTVPTYLNDAVATTSRQQLSQAKQPRADNSSLSTKQSICWSRENTQNDDASTNSNDAASQRSCKSTPADQQQPIQRNHYQQSTTGCETPSSACTRRPDEIGVDGFSLSRMAGTISGEGGGGAKAATAAACLERRGRRPRARFRV